MGKISIHLPRSIRSLGAKTREVGRAGMKRKLTSRLRGLLWGLALLTIAPEPAHAQLITWYNGTFVNTDLILSCIVGTLEVRMQGYLGYGLRPGNRTPAVGEVWYAHIVLSHPGNICAGGSYTHIEFWPPPNTQLAVSAGDPLFCFWRRHDQWVGSQSYGTVFNMAANCPQVPGIGVFGGYNLDSTTPSGRLPWGVSNYSWMEFLVPLRSTGIVNGNNATALLNPDIGIYAYPTVPVFVNADVIFRDSFQNVLLPLDICGLPHTSGC